MRDTKRLEKVFDLFLDSISNISRKEENKRFENSIESQFVGFLYTKSQVEDRNRKNLEAIETAKKASDRIKAALILELKKIKV